MKIPDLFRPKKKEEIKKSSMNRRIVTENQDRVRIDRETNYEKRINDAERRRKSYGRD